LGERHVSHEDETSGEPQSETIQHHVGLFQRIVDRAHGRYQLTPLVLGPDHVTCLTNEHAPKNRFKGTMLRTTTVLRRSDPGRQAAQFVSLSGFWPVSGRASEIRTIPGRAIERRVRKDRRAESAPRAPDLAFSRGVAVRGSASARDGRRAGVRWNAACWSPGHEARDLESDNGSGCRR
jgi:hypothetical protein